MVFEEVCAELESYGYQVAPVIIPACAVGAPHRRERIWFVAYAPGIRNDSTQSGGVRSEDAETNRERTYPFYDGITPKSDKGVIADTDGSDERDYPRANDRETEKVWRQNARDVFREFRGDGNVTNTERVRLEYSTTPRQVSGKEKNANGERSKSTLLTQTNDDGYKSDWDNFPTQSPICSGDDGIPTELDGIAFPKWRNETIKAYGNAIVPQVAYQIFKAIEKTLYL
jgi:DNA (cytosine-5)-methyltransferase 1